MTLALAVAALACSCSTPQSGQVEQRSGQAEVQLAHLNHFFATVDPLTAEAIRNSRFLREFANFELRTTTGTQDSWTGRYLRGRQTYVEFFGPEDFHINGQPAPVGAWGVGLSGDRVGDLAALRARLEAAGHNTLVEQNTRRFGERTVPWFTSLTSVNAHGDSAARDESVFVWAMEYHPSYFELPEADIEPAEGEGDLISRERYLPDLYVQKMMRDVTFVRFAVAAEDFARIEPLLRAAGFRISRSADHVTATGEEMQFRFDLTPPNRQGLREIRFLLNAPVARQVEAIGRSTLVIGPGPAAIWTFD